MNVWSNLIDFSLICLQNWRGAAWLTDKSGMDMLCFAISKQLNMQSNYEYPHLKLTGRLSRGYIVQRPGLLTSLALLKLHV